MTARSCLPRAVDRHPVASGVYVVDRSMSVSNIAAGNADRAAQAFEPGANIIRSNNGANAS
jgi:hypothetical protein